MADVLQGEADDDLRPLQILATAIAGRSVEVASAEPGSRTWTDGRSIYLEGGVPRRDQLRLLGVQASLIAGGSLDPDVVQQLRHHRSLAARYLAVEGHRALAANHDSLPPWMRSMTDHALAGRLGSASDSLALARRDRALEPSWVFGTIDPRRVTGRVDDVDPATTGPARSASTEPALVGMDALDDGDDDPGLGNLLSSPVGGGGAIGRLLAKLLRPSRARDGGGPPGADAPTHLSRDRPGLGRTVVSTAAPAGSDDGIAAGQPATHLYPEWDHRRQAYRADWCQVVEDLGAIDAGSRTVLADGASMRRVLARLGTGLTPCRRRRQGDDLDIDAVVEARVGLLTGAPHTDDVYIESLRQRRDLSVLLLLDISGSAAEPGVAGRTVHEHQRDAAGVLMAGLHRLGDRVALYAFSSRGRKAVRLTRVKGFDDLLDGRACQRLGALEPGAFTRLGAAIRHGSAVLDAKGGTPRRLLVVLSDGFAYDHGYEGRHGEADARRALLEARHRGIGCLCLSVGADADLAALRRVFGATAHAALPTAEGLPGVIGPLFASALRSAEAQRRRFQRQERTHMRLVLEEAGR